MYLKSYSPIFVECQPKSAFSPPGLGCNISKYPPLPMLTQPTFQALMNLSCKQEKNDKLFIPTVKIKLGNVLHCTVGRVLVA